MSPPPPARPAFVIAVMACRCASGISLAAFGPTHLSCLVSPSRAGAHRTTCCIHRCIPPPLQSTWTASKELSEQTARLEYRCCLLTFAIYSRLQPSRPLPSISTCSRVEISRLQNHHHLYHPPTPFFLATFYNPTPISHHLHHQPAPLQFLPAAPSQPNTNLPPPISTNHHPTQPFQRNEKGTQHNKLTQPILRKEE